MGWWLWAVAVDAGTGLGLAVGERVVWWAGWCVQAWWCWALHVTRHAGLALLFLWWRRESRSALPASGHYALEEVGRTVSYRGWRWLRWACMGSLGWSTALLKLVLQSRNLVFISK